MAKKPSNRTPVNKESDDLVFAVCERFFQRIVSNVPHEESSDGRDRTKSDDSSRGFGATAVSREIAKELCRPDLTRERIYPLLWEGLNRGYLTMNVPPEILLRRRLIEEFNLKDHLEKNDGEIFVANTVVGNIAARVNEVAADEIIKLIERVQKEKQEKAKATGQDPNSVRVHIGFGAGYAAEEVARRLSTRAGSETPKLTLHALTSGGYYVAGQQKAPTTYFSFFDGKVQDAEFVGLFVPPIVQSREYVALKNNPSCRLVYSRRDEIDILVTSFATAEDEHGLLRQYYSYLLEEKVLADNVIEDLETQGWVGDVMFQPYSKEGAIDSCPFKAATLFDFNELLDFSQQQGKYVVITCGPCGVCKARKTKAIRPLLENPALRLWTHLIIDRGTAEDLMGANNNKSQD